MFSKIIFLLSFIGLFLNALNAQDVILTDSTKVVEQQELEPDTLVKIKKHSPKTALLLSLAPGVGQIYNKKYWKAPIIWGGIATATYFALSNRDSMKVYREAYINRFNDDETDDVLLQYNTETLNVLQSEFRSNMEVMYIVAGAVYLLNLVDAVVDAHLFTFDISDDLSFKVMPEIRNAHSPRFASTGVNLSFHF